MPLILVGKMKSNESHPSDFETGENVCKKIRSRYVYSSHCNTIAVESLLAMSKGTAFKVFCSKVKPISTAHPYLCGSNSKSLKSGVKAVTGRWSYPRSYAQVVKNNC